MFSGAREKKCWKASLRGRDGGCGLKPTRPLFLFLSRGSLERLSHLKFGPLDSISRVRSSCLLHTQKKIVLNARLILSGRKGGSRFPVEIASLQQASSCLLTLSSGNVFSLSPFSSAFSPSRSFFSQQ
jgi:hypothetical protein